MDHTIQTNDPIMKLVGMQIFDLDTLEDFAKSHQTGAQFAPYITIDPLGATCTPGELYGGVLTGVAEIMRWDDDDRAYETTALNTYPVVDEAVKPEAEWASIANDLVLREKYRHESDSEDYFSDYSFNLDQAEDLVGDIKNSCSGDAVWHPELYYVVGGRFVQKFAPRLSISLFDSSKSPMAQEIATYAPFIADIPRTKGGLKYGARETEKREDKDGIASYRPVIEGGRANPDNLRAGELDVTYNRTIGKFEAGTRQVLVRLTTDILSVNSPGFDPDTVHSLDHDQVYKKDAPFNQIGDWDKGSSIGSGIPVNIQKGNPYLFGPNYVNRYGKDDEYRKEEIRITNRTPRNFQANQLVMCSFLDGEWIPQDLGQDGGIAAKFSVQRWQFQKLVAGADDFFRDGRYLNPSAPDYTKQRIDPQSYEIMMRNRFYLGLKNYLGGSTSPVPDGNHPVDFLTDLDPQVFGALGYMNLGNNDDAVLDSEDPKNWDFIPSNRYIQVTAFDQMGNFAGGRNKANVIARTNAIAPIDTTKEDSDPFAPYEMMEYWGPTFPRGFNSEDVQGLSSVRKNVTLRPMPDYGSHSTNDFFFQETEFEYVATTGEPALVDNLPDRNVSISYAGKGMFFNSRDKTALNLPAEVGTNGPPNQDRCSPIENLSALDDTANESQNLVDAFELATRRDYATGEQTRFNWLYRHDEDDPVGGVTTPVYGFRPNSPNSIDFYPLAAEVVSSTDYNRGGTSPEPGVSLEYGMLPLMARNTEIRNAVWHKDFITNGVDHLLGSDHLFIRNLHVRKRDFVQYSYNGFASASDPSKKNYTLPYFGYVEKRSTGDNKISLPAIWPDEQDENASCVGVIASRCRIFFRGDGLKFNLDQQFGLQTDTRSTLGTAGSFTAIGNIFSASTQGTQSSSNSYPRWGGLSDEPNRFKTTALHMKMFDAWPEDQTIYDARYFSVFHFNPGSLLSRPDQAEEEITVPGVAPFKPDVLTESVDFRVPTYPDNTPAKPGDVIDGDVILADEENWRVNTMRRGMMLSDGGFRYYKTSCGVKESSIIDGGTGYEDQEILEVSGGSGKDATVKISVDASGTIVSMVAENRGEGYIPSDFGDPSDPTTSKLSLVGGKGTGSDVKITKGIMHRVEYLDEGPKNRSQGYIRLTDGNGDGRGNTGKGFVEGPREQFLTIEEQNDTGEYDMFFYFHNDITHTVHDGGGRMLIEPQRVSMEITAL